MSIQIQSRPILFSTPMVQALLNGTKTQTRRIIKDSFNGCWTGTNGGIQVGGHPCPNDPIVIHPGEVIKAGDWLEEETPDLIAENTVVEAWFHCSTMDKTAKCPYGKIGDTLWVRETWKPKGHNFPIGHPYEYRATAEQDLTPTDGPWKPSIFMPREASRITLFITDIRVERLLSISEEDARAEGIDEFGGLYRDYFTTNEYKGSLSAKDSYFTLWDKINGKDAHKVNPWVWAITFKVVTNGTK